MKKVKRFLISLCLVVTLALAIPGVALATGDGPQGGTRSTTTTPPPPPPSAAWLALLAALRAAGVI